MTAEPPLMDYAAFVALAPEAYKALSALTRAVDEAGLDKRLTELVKLRASQINGCAFCLQYHLTLARKAGVEERKLDLLAAWRDAGLFSPRERAALAWAERLTRIGTGPHEAEEALLRAEFTREEAAFLTLSVATINAWNRLGVGLRFAPPTP